MVKPAAVPARSPTLTGATLTVPATATLIVLMDYTAPMTTLTATASALEAGVAGQTWILNGMPVGLAALLLIAGNIGDSFGRKRVFVGGAALLTLTMMLGGATSSTAVFVLARLVQGFAGAALIATSLALIAQAIPDGSGRIRAMGVWGASVGAGIALGPLVSGLLGCWHWRACYWVFAGLAAITAVAAHRTLVESRREHPVRLDVFGAATFGLGLAALMAALTEGRDGWLRPLVGALIAAAALLLIAFGVGQARAHDPLLELGLFRSRLFLIATSGALFTGLAVIGFMSYLPTILQLGLRLSPVATAALLGVWSGTAAVVALHARRLSIRLPVRCHLPLGLALCGAGTMALLGAVAAGSWMRLLPGLVIAGIGSGLVNASLPRLAVASVPPGRSATGSGANNTARYVGSAIGLTIIIAVVTSAAGTGRVPDLSQRADAAILVAAGLSFAGAAVAAALREPTETLAATPTSPPSPDPRPRDEPRP